MPLSEAEREVLRSEADGSPMPAPSPSWLRWTDALYHLWLQRRQIFRWVVLGFILSLVVAWRYPKYESTAQIMPPDSGGSGLASLLPALSKVTRTYWYGKRHDGNEKHERDFLPECWKAAPCRTI